MVIVTQNVRWLNGQTMFDQTSDQLKACFGEFVGFSDVNGKFAE